MKKQKICYNGYDQRGFTSMSKLNTAEAEIEFVEFLKLVLMPWSCWDEN